MSAAVDTEFYDLDKLGEGWSGEVYRARLSRPAWGLAAGEFVALKAYKPTILAVESNIEVRIQREAAILADCRHPNIVRAFGHATMEIGGQMRHCLVMEYCEQGDLPRFVAKAKAVHPIDPWTLVVELASGLSALHAMHVVHRDVKPQNVLVSASGRPKIGDLGVARRSVDLTLTGSHEFLGTIRYAAPEVLDGNLDTSASDVYSLGLVIYELLYDLPPYADVNRFTTLIVQKTSRELEWPRVNRRGGTSDLNYELLKIIGREMVTREVEGRPSINTVCHWLSVGISADCAQKTIERAIQDVLRHKSRDLRKKADSKAWISPLFNARRVVDAIDDDACIVAILSGNVQEAIENSPLLLSRATAHLPWDEYAALSVESRRLFVESFRADYPWWIGQVPWDEAYEIERARAKYDAKVKDLLDVETDQALRDLLSNTMHDFL